MLRNYKLKIEYNGKGFSGSQIQDNERTVQSEIDRALRIYFKEDTKSIFSSRTDSGVHAIGQVANFKTAEEVRDPYRTLHSLNGLLPEDIALTKIEEVPENFHARYDAESREYLYKIFTRRQRPVLRLDSLAWVKEPLDFEKMAAHAKTFLGEHDFSRYAYKPEDNNPNCNIYESEMIRESDICFKFRIKGNRFLRRMVRNIVGELIDVGIDGTPKEKIIAAPAEGLTLMKVAYVPHEIYTWDDSKHGETMTLELN